MLLISISNKPLKYNFVYFTVHFIGTLISVASLINKSV